MNDPIPPQHRVVPNEVHASPVAATYPDSTPGSDAVLLPAVHAITQPLIDAARQHGPLPAVRSQAFLDAPRDVQVAALLVVATAYLVADPHRTIRHVLLGASDDIRAAWPAGIADRWLPHEDAQRRRYPPHGDPQQWVRHGGRPDAA